MKTQILKRWSLRAALVLVAVYVALFGTVLGAMLRPPEQFGAFMKHMPPALVWAALPAPRMWLWARKGTLSKGELAPAFSLRMAKDRRHGVVLSSYQAQRPVALVFGSYTWPPFRRAVPALDELYCDYRDRVAFHVVYIEEAHPI